VREPDVRVTRLISLVTEQFVQSVADDAYRCAVQRHQAQAKDKRERGYDTRDKRIVLENEDLAAALKDHGVNLHKPPYYVGAARPEEVEEHEEAVKEELNEEPTEKKRRSNR
jgi:transcription initiation factor TFIID subunit 10